MEWAELAQAPETELAQTDNENERTRKMRHLTERGTEKGTKIQNDIKERSKFCATDTGRGHKSKSEQALLDDSCTTTGTRTRPCS